MRTLEDIFGTRVKRDILFEDGLWCIYRRDMTGAQRRRRVLDRGVFIAHRCSKSVGAPYPGKYTCTCQTEAPDSIRTLYTLHQWDR